MLRGLATVSYWAEDLEAAKAWYADLLGIEPYFNVPSQDGSLAYTEFRIGDHEAELGLINRSFAPFGATPPTPGGVIVYWHVDDVPATLAKLIEKGARQLEAPRDRGQGFITATVIDPFGNVLGIMFNPHYLDMLNRAAAR